MTRREFLKWMVRGVAVAWLAPRALASWNPTAPGEREGHRDTGPPRYWLEGQPGRCATAEQLPFWPPDTP